MHFNWAFSFMPYGQGWRQHRRAFEKYLGHNVLAQYYPIIYEERLILLQQLSAQPKRFMDHLLLCVLYDSLFQRTMVLTPL